jgi:hypothetical protein
MHRLIFDQAPRPPEAAARLRALEQALAAAVAAHLQRLGVGGSSPLARALLLVQGIEAQVHGAVLTPPDGSSTAEMVEELRRLWLAALRGA